MRLQQPRSLVTGNYIPGALKSLFGSYELGAITSHENLCRKLWVPA